MSVDVIKFLQISLDLATALYKIEKEINIPKVYYKKYFNTLIRQKCVKRHIHNYYLIFHHIMLFHPPKTKI